MARSSNAGTLVRALGGIVLVLAILYGVWIAISWLNRAAA